MMLVKIYYVSSVYVGGYGSLSESGTCVFRDIQTTQPTSDGDVTVVTNCCANCVEPSRPQECGPDLPFFGQASHADPLDG